MLTTPPGGRSAHPPVIEIIVPARNEARRLPAGLGALCEKAATLPVRTAILVVDSASTDSTAEVVRRWPAGPVPVGLLHCDRPGKGIAVRAGLLATQAPFVGFCDADMATDLSALDVAVSFLAAGHPLVIGSRGLSGSVVEARSSTLRGARRHPVPDDGPPGSSREPPTPSAGSSSSPGRWPGRRSRSLRTAGFAFDVELLAACLRLGATVTEIPVHWRDIAGSTFSVRRHSAAVFRDLGAIWLRSRMLRGGSATTPAAVSALHLYRVHYRDGSASPEP